jgi:pilus assembly protein CpaF
MAHGAGGALATVRTASVDGALPALAALAGAATPTASTRLAATTAGHAVDLIVHLERTDDGARRVREVALPVLQGRHYGLSTLVSFEPGRRRGHGRFRHYPVSARLARRLRAGGESIPPVFRADHFGTPTRA